MTRLVAVLLVTAACSDGKVSTAPHHAVFPGIVAHRGASKDAPENTIAAVKLAYAQGASGVEVDVWRSKDGHIVVFHDKTTKRFGGPDMPISEQTLEQLRRLDVGGGQRVPVLREVLESVPRGRTLFIEIKSGPATVADIAEVVREFDAGARGIHVGYQSFSLETMSAVRREFSLAEVYWLRGVRRERGTNRALPIDPVVAKQASDANVPGLAIDYRGWSRALDQAIQHEKVMLYVWTVDDPDEVRRVSEWGPFWIETNVPAVAAAAVRLGRDTRKGNGTE